MNFKKWKATKLARKVPDNIDKLRVQYNDIIHDNMTKHGIPEALVINLDEKGLPVRPASEWTLAEAGAKQVLVTGLDDKRQITGVLACTLSGEFCCLS